MIEQAINTLFNPAFWLPVLVFFGVLSLGVAIAAALPEAEPTDTGRDI